jgi:putative SOS response-associated peptidase YedK
LGFPVALVGKKGQPLKPKAVNNARFDKLGAFWRRWAHDPGNGCLIPATRFAEAVGEHDHDMVIGEGRADFCWAGLWRSSDEWGDCYTGVMSFWRRTSGTHG